MSYKADPKKMTKACYLKRKMIRETNAIQKTRGFCRQCWQPQFNCFCHKIETFDPLIEFVVLIHPIESRRRIATGRMAYLTLRHAHIIRGLEFSKNPAVEELLADRNFNNIILMRAPHSMDVTSMSESKRVEKFSTSKKLRVFLVDGTWAHAGKMITKSPKLSELPCFSFTPPKPSNIRVRKQPNELCLSTLEAIHHIIELLGPSQGFCVKPRTHDRLLTPFNWMVERQIDRIKDQRKWRAILGHT